jgi:hypothetical protein
LFAINTEAIAAIEISPQTPNLIRLEGFVMANWPVDWLNRTATLLDSISLYNQPVICTKPMSGHRFFRFGLPRYLAGRHVIPQFCGVFQS